MGARVDSPKTALVLGGNSDIAHAVLHRLASAGLERAVLATRDAEGLRARLASAPLPIIDVTVAEWDALDVSAHQPLLERANEAMGGIDLVLCAVGSLGHGAGISAGPQAVADLIAANFTGPATAITAAAQHLQTHGGGTIVVLSSVAGLRPRRSNYLYGSAKAGLDAFTQGLADGVAGNVRVHLLRPGFVRSKMTAGLSPAPFATDPDAVAAAVADVVRAPKSRIVHVPALLGPMFGLLRLAPRPLWRRLAGDR